MAQNSDILVNLLIEKEQLAAYKRELLEVLANVAGL